jgi:hypothetical protein
MSTKSKVPNRDLYNWARSNNSEQLENYLTNNQYDFDSYLTIGKQLTLLDQVIESNSYGCYKVIMYRISPKKYFVYVREIVRTLKYTEQFYKFLLERINDIMISDPHLICNDQHNIFYKIFIELCKLPINVNKEILLNIIESPHLNFIHNMFTNEYKYTIEKHIIEAKLGTLQIVIDYYRTNNIILESLFSLYVQSYNPSSKMIKLIKTYNLDLTANVPINQDKTYNYMFAAVLFYYKASADLLTIEDILKFDKTNLERFNKDLIKLLGTNDRFNVRPLFSEISSCHRSDSGNCYLGSDMIEFPDRFMKYKQIFTKEFFDVIKSAVNKLDKRGEKLYIVNTILKKLSINEEVVDYVEV